MSIFFPGSSKVPRLDFELSPGCDHACGHCYNVWNAKPGDPQHGYPSGQLKDEQFLVMMEKAVKESGADHITITGGEPLLRKNALEVIERACQLVSSVQLITNGSHVTEEVASRLKKAGVRSVQLTLLAADRELHDRLKGAECFDDTLRAAATLREHGVYVQVCFVAMHENWQTFEEVMELCWALGVKAIAYNRMSATGWSIHELERLMPDVEQVEHNLATAERLGKKYGIYVATAMPIPPCLIRQERYPSVKFGFCSVGSESPNLTIDALGNVRSCNLSSGILGNILEKPWHKIYPAPYVQRFVKNVPELCRGCHYERSCQGGCKESGFATYGSHAHPEPFLHFANHPEERASRSARLRVIGA
jgi:radical SAM protein with 4Fe4S-binding SPASM domain